MIFLLEYDRDLGKVLAFHRFDDRQRVKAEEARLHLELELNRDGVSREVVLLEASDEIALRKTHRRYFEKLSDLADTQPG